jgi:hypothetical protein
VSYPSVNQLEISAQPTKDPQHLRILDMPGYLAGSARSLPPVNSSGSSVASLTTRGYTICSTQQGGRVLRRLWSLAISTLILMLALALLAMWLSGVSYADTLTVQVVGVTDGNNGDRHAEPRWPRLRAGLGTRKCTESQIPLARVP